MRDRPTFDEFKKKALQNSDVKKEYESLKPLYEIKKKLISQRLKRGLTQEQIATELGTTKSNISRLESLNNTYSPNLTTLIKYADVLDMQLEVDLV